MHFKHEFPEKQNLQKNLPKIKAPCDYLSVLSSFKLTFPRFEHAWINI